MGVLGWWARAGVRVVCAGMGGYDAVRNTVFFVSQLIHVLDQMAMGGLNKENA